MYRSGSRDHLQAFMQGFWHAASIIEVRPRLAKEPFAHPAAVAQAGAQKRCLLTVLLEVSRLCSRVSGNVFRSL